MTDSSPAAGTLPACFDRLVTADPSRPLITWYRLADGARVELSAATAAGWVAKCAGLLRDGLGLNPGDRVAVDLGSHWLTCLLPLAVWRAEGVLSATGTADVVALPAGMAVPRPGQEVLAVSEHPMALPVPVPAGTWDLSAGAMAQPDRFSGPLPTPGDPARVDPTARTHAAELAAAQSLGLRPEDRILVDGDADLAERWFAVIAGAASLVAVDGDATPELVATERITRTV